MSSSYSYPPLPYPRGLGCLPVPLPNRNEGLPRIARQDSHPLIPISVQDHVHNVYIYLSDPDPLRAAAWHTYAEQNLRIPSCSPELLTAKFGVYLLLFLNLLRSSLPFT